MEIKTDVKKKLLQFLKSQKKLELLDIYSFWLESSLLLSPVVFLKDKIIFQSYKDAIEKLEVQGKIWRETEIKIGSGFQSVNDETKKIYICPFTGKVFADNIYSNPQDAIYDWLSKCKENTERQGGVRLKRFFISEDPEIIKNYIQPQKKSISKVVFSSAVSGKLFSSKDVIIESFKKNYLKPISLVEVQNQNKFQIEDSFLSVIQEHLQEDKITAFLETLVEDPVFHPYISEWIDSTE